MSIFLSSQSPGVQQLGNQVPQLAPLAPQLAPQLPTQLAPPIPQFEPATIADLIVSFIFHIHCFNICQFANKFYFIDL